MRFGFLIASAAALLGIAGAPAARAGLIGDGTNTVSAFFYINAPATPSGGGCDQSTESFCEQQFNLSTGMAQFVLTIPAHFDQAAISGSTTDVGDTQIVITNQIPATFCSDGVSAGSACTDPFTGFEFLFSSGVDITGVSVDSSSDFLPNGTPPHLGLQLLSPTDILVDVTGAAPAIGGKLILDVTTGGVTPVPEASTWALMLLGFAGLGFAGWRRTAAEAT
jgi:PEP-CTERM motif